jgi:hypothetical protein
MGWDDKGGVGSPESPTSRHRRDRKGKTLPLIHTDDTDKETGAFTAEVAEGAKENGVGWDKPTPNWEAEGGVGGEIG